MRTRLTRWLRSELERMADRHCDQCDGDGYLLVDDRSDDCREVACPCTNYEPPPDDFAFSVWCP